MTSASIARAEARLLAVPTGMKPFVLPNGHRTPTELSALMIRITDTDGAIGQSLLWAQRDSQLAVYQAGLRYFAEVVEGFPLDNADNLVPAMRSAGVFLGLQGAMAFAVSGYEMAMWDLRCRRDNLSLGRSLGRRRDRVRAYQTGLMLNATVEELVEEAHAIAERGLRGIKMIVGQPTLDEDVERVAAVRAALPDVSLMVDALQRWTLDQSIEAAERLAEFDIVWLEDPTDSTDIRAYTELAKRSPIPIATGETLFTSSAFGELLDAGLPYLIAELERVGGVSEWMRIAALVSTGAATILPHVYPDVSAQLLSAAASDAVWWEYVTWFDSLMAEPFEIADGTVVVSDRPGTGFEPDPAAIERYARTPWSALGR